MLKFLTQISACYLSVSPFPTRGKLAYVPFATKVEALTEDADVNSILGSRCCRNDRGPSVEMATSYAWLTSMSIATEKDSHVLKNTIGADPEAGRQTSDLAGTT